MPFVYIAQVDPIATSSALSAERCEAGQNCNTSSRYSTQSYTGYEPTSMRAIRARCVAPLQPYSEHPAQVRPCVFFRYFLLRYNPYLQAKGRIDQLKSLGHSTDKVEYIIMGGTFMSLPDDYRDWFIRSLHDTLSGHTSNSVDEAVRDVFPPLSFCNILHRYVIANKAGRSASASLLKLGPTTATSRI